MTQRRPALNIAVIGHTNTGKTSLLRTLLRDSQFGEVADSPSTTRHSQSIVIDIGSQSLKLTDTPGIEDSMALIDAIDSMEGEYGIDRIHQFLQQDAPSQELDLSQEIKVLKQILSADLLLYVIDSREPVLGKYQDELTVLKYSAKPVLPILNFVAHNHQSQQWQQQLKKNAIHAVVLFDTIAYQFEAEINLYRSIAALLPEQQKNLEQIIQTREQDWQQLGAQSALLIADCLIDIAAFYLKATSDNLTALTDAQETIKQREQRACDDLSMLFAFYQKPEAEEALTVRHGIWQQDLFDPQLWLALGLDNGKAAAKGAALGLGVDMATGGMTLGMATLVGAGLGVIYNNANQVLEKARGYKIYRADLNTLSTCALRLLALLATLQARGHASLAPIRFKEAHQELAGTAFAKLIKTAQKHGEYSSLNPKNRYLKSSHQRQQLQQQLADIIGSNAQQ